MKELAALFASVIDRDGTISRPDFRTATHNLNLLYEVGPVDLTRPCFSDLIDHLNERPGAYVARPGL